MTMADLLRLPVRNALQAGGGGGRGASAEFYCPGSILAVDVNSSHSVGREFRAPVPGVWFEGSPAFEITDASTASAVLTYPASGDPLLSGWLLGGSKLNGKAALVDVKRGSGHVYLFGFRPQYRGQPNSTFQLMWAAMK